MIIVSHLFLVLVSFEIISSDRTVRRLNYKLDSDITTLVSDNIISYELTRIESTASMSILEIETEQWVHDCCFIITAQPVLRIRLKQEHNYPKITVYLQLRTPLSSIVMTGTGSIITTNSIRSDSLGIDLSGTTKAKLQVEIVSKLDIIISGTSDVILSGYVKGNGYIRLTGADTLDARTCPMSLVTVDVTGIGTTYVVGEQAVDIGVAGVGHVYYYGPLRNQRVNGLGSISSLLNVDSKTYDSTAAKQTISIFTVFSFLLLHTFL